MPLPRPRPLSHTHQRETFGCLITTTIQGWIQIITLWLWFGSIWDYLIPNPLCILALFTKRAHTRLIRSWLSTLGLVSCSNLTSENHYAILITSLTSHSLHRHLRQQLHEPYNRQLYLEVHDYRPHTSLSQDYIKTRPSTCIKEIPSPKKSWRKIITYSKSPKEKGPIAPPLRPNCHS